jgi:hypothetical protein
VLLEGVEVSYRRRVEHGREELDLLQPILGMLARLPAAREERLERLRSELNHPVAVDPPRPPPDQVVARRTEHAQLHLALLTGNGARRAKPASAAA